MSFRNLRRAAFLLAIALASSDCVVSAAAAIAEAAEPEVGTAPRVVAVEDVQALIEQDKGKPDAEVARQLSRLQLSERMSLATLRLLEESVPGSASRSALTALADASVFLDAPAADVLAQVPPDLNEQRRMVALTVDYLGKTLPRLPNFYAVRTTVRYDADLDVHRIGLRKRAASDEGAPWRRVGISRATVVYRDGKEVLDPRAGRKHSSHPEDEGLVTWGTFGPILSTVIVDAAHGEMTWDHWERGTTGTLAVFRYSVPENQSHYAVAFHSVSSNTAEAKPATGYHGEAAIDPAAGTILRLTVQADPPLGSPIFRGDIMVEYGPVEIGGKIYTCPVRSVSIALDEMGLMGGMDIFDHSARPKNTTLMNDVTFEDYHLFRSNTRIMTGFIPVPGP